MTTTNCVSFPKETIQECMRLHHSACSRKYKKNLVLFVYGMQHKYYTIPTKYSYIKLLLPELVREMASFILDFITKGNYYKVIDNYGYSYIQQHHFANQTNIIGHHNRMQYYIGKIIDTNIETDTHLVSYLGWNDSFNEYISGDQIQKIDYSVSNYLLSLRINDLIDVFNIVTKRWHMGKVTNVHKLHGKIVAVDLITYHTHLTSNRIFVYGQNIPIYSKHIMVKHFHVQRNYNRINKFSLAWAFKTYFLHKDRYFTKKHTSLEKVTIIDKHYVSFSFKSSHSPHWSTINRRNVIDLGV